MDVMAATAAVVHGGGPTAVLNASLAGIIAAAARDGRISNVLGARFGTRGLMQGDLVPLSPGGIDLDLLRRSPGSLLGSSRFPLGDAERETILAILRKRDIRYLFLTGGNGTMGTALDLHRLAGSSGYELHVIGVPKTIDNDISGTDHTPGYGSCARFFAYAARDAGEDNRSLPSPVMFLEVLGRNAGWLVAATSLARRDPDDPPHLIYCPERRLSLDRLCGDVEGVYRRLGRCVVAVCEGQTDEHGGWFDADLVSAPGARDPLPANLGHLLARKVWERTGLRCRCERPGLVARSSSSLASEVDRREAEACGRAAVEHALEGESGVMIGIDRVSTAPYHAQFLAVNLEACAAKERLFPPAWILDHDVAEGYREWASPIVGDVPRLARLRVL